MSSSTLFPAGEAVGKPPVVCTSLTLERRHDGSFEITEATPPLMGDIPLTEEVKVERVLLDTKSGTKITLDHVFSGDTFWKIINDNPPTGSPYWVYLLHRPTGAIGYRYRYILRCDLFGASVTYKAAPLHGAIQPVILMDMAVMQSAGELYSSGKPGPLHKGSHSIPDQDKSAFVKKVLADGPPKHDPFFVLHESTTVKPVGVVPKAETEYVSGKQKFELDLSDVKVNKGLLDKYSEILKEQSLKKAKEENEKIKNDGFFAEEADDEPAHASKPEPQEEVKPPLPPKRKVLLD